MLATRYGRGVRAAALVLAPAILAQSSEESLLRRTPVTISGIAVDAEGNPIPHVRIDHTKELDDDGIVSTDTQGRFRVETQAPLIVFRKPGYQSGVLRVEPAEDVRIVMEPAREVLPACGSSTVCFSLSARDALFCLPAVPGLEIRDPGADTRYELRWFLLHTEKATKGIVHGSGHFWSLGMPYDRDVWSSAEYSEKVYRLDTRSIVDARGVTRDGRHWRYLGKFGESASYRDVDGSEAALFDQVLDGACTLAPGLPRLELPPPGNSH